ncbi:MAG: hypothetical protein D6717_00805 [Gammaproteobacteria bacterium]|nr:MAG: hypothetical protein D6717_00805 [Gammaproteobacteria bacterium]
MSRLPFNARPGAHERHLRRALDNPLFPPQRRKATPQDVLREQRRDYEELMGFVQRFEDLVREAAELPANAEADVVLELKERLDRAYEEASGLGGDIAHIREALIKLIGVTMAAVRRAAGDDDPTALEKLDMEDQARALHFRLLEHPLIADLLRPDDLIPPEDLVPTLLSESEDAVAAAIAILEPEQLALIVRDAQELLARVEKRGEAVPEAARARLEQMRAALPDTGAEPHDSD